MKHHNPKSECEINQRARLDQLIDNPKKVLLENKKNLPPFNKIEKTNSIKSLKNYELKT